MKTKTILLASCRAAIRTIAAEKLFNMISGKHEESVVFPWE